MYRAYGIHSFLNSRQECTPGPPPPQMRFSRFSDDEADKRCRGGVGPLHQFHSLHLPLIRLSNLQMLWVKFLKATPSSRALFFTLLVRVAISNLPNLSNYNAHIHEIANQFMNHSTRAMGHLINKTPLGGSGSGNLRHEK